MSRLSRQLGLLCLVGLVVLSANCDYTARMEFHNRTFETLTPYPVNPDLDPPRREEDPANNLAPRDSTVIDPAGFNPVFYVAGINSEEKANGVYLGLSLVGSDPLQVQYKLFHYKVPPGKAGSDPDKQPILLKTEVIEIENVDTVISVRDTGGTLPGWDVLITPR